MGTIIIFSFIYNSLGFFFGLLVKVIIKPEDDMKGAIVTTTGFGNSVALPIALISALRDAPPFRPYPNAIPQAMGFIS